VFAMGLRCRPDTAGQLVVVSNALRLKRQILLIEVERVDAVQRGDPIGRPCSVDGRDLRDHDGVHVVRIAVGACTDLGDLVVIVSRSPTLTAMAERRPEAPENGLLRIPDRVHGPEEHDGAAIPVVLSLALVERRTERSFCRGGVESESRELPKGGATVVYFGQRYFEN